MTDLKRPARHDDRVIDHVAEKLQPEVGQWLKHAGDTDDALESIKVALSDARDWDGYSLAKCLDDNEGWSPDMDLCNTLDRAEDYRGSKHRELVREWVQTNDIRPKLNVGQVITTSINFEKTSGAIAKIDHLDAVYHIKVEGFNGFYLKPFEEVEKENL